MSVTWPTQALNGGVPAQFQFLVQEADVEGGVVDDDFRARQVLHQFVGDRGELGLVAQELVADAVDLERVLVAVALRVQVEMLVVAGELAGRPVPRSRFR